MFGNHKNTPGRFTPDQLQELKLRLHVNKREVVLRGHTWDVADIMAVVEQFDADISS